MFPLTKEYVMQKVDAEMKRIKARQAKSLAYDKRDLKRNGKRPWVVQSIERAEVLLKSKALTQLPGIPFKVRTSEFRGPGGKSRDGSRSWDCSHDFSIETGVAHSYEWYQLGKVINGQYVVNTFNYSRTTMDHVYALKGTLKMLCIPFIEVEAPAGLQDLDRALEHAVTERASKMIKHQFARTKENKRFYMDAINEYNATIELLVSMGAESRRDALTALSEAGAKYAEKRERNRVNSQAAREAKRVEAAAELVRVAELAKQALKTSQRSKGKVA